MDSCREQVLRLGGDIPLSEILRVDEPHRFKLHLARWDRQNHPLNIYVRSRDDWDNWNRWRSTKDDFNREFIFSLMDYYPQRDRWLFGGVYRVTSTTNEPQSFAYQIERVARFEPFVGRMKVILPNPGRSRAFRLENLYSKILVDEILPAPYSGEAFCGFDRIHLTFAELETLMVSQRPDWKTALEHAKGIYLITDSSNGKKYVGSAYGSAGIWSRWSNYVATGHGGNLGLREVIHAPGLDHARANFSFCLLEHFPPGAPDEIVLDRESYWKRVLLSRSDYGYNGN